MTTPEEKDALLIKVINDPENDWLSVDPVYADKEFKTLSRLMRQFESMGLITIKSPPGKMDDTFTIQVEQEAEDFILRGGFKFQEQIFRNNFTKLELELAKLEKGNPTINFKSAATLVGALAAGMDIYKGLTS